jgi:hypothetical protein
MEKPTFSKTSINPKGQQFIQVDSRKWNDMGFVEGRMTGFLEVKPEHADTVLDKLNDGTLITSFGDKNTATGLYEVQIVEKASV